MKKFFKNAFLATAMLGTLSAYAVDPGTLTATVTPADGSTIAKGETLTLTYSSDIELVDSPAEDIVIYRTVEVTDGFNQSTVWNDGLTISGNQLSFAVNPYGFNETMDIKIVIPEGIVKSTTSTSVNEAMTLYYTYEVPVVEGLEVALCNNTTSETNEINIPINVKPSNASATLDASVVPTFTSNGGDAVSCTATDSGFGFCALRPEGIESTITIAGTYVLNIPEGFYVLDGVKSKPFSFTWTVTESNALEVYSWNPEADNMVNYDAPVIITFDTDNNVEIADNGGEDICLTNMRTGNLTWLPLTYDFDFPGLTGGNQVGFYFKPLNAQKGDVIVVELLPGTIYDLDTNAENEYTKITYLMGDGGEVPTFPTVTWTPESGSNVALESTVVLNFGRYISSSSVNMDVITLTNTTKNTTSKAVLKYHDDSDKFQFAFNPTDAEVGDKISVEIPADIFYLPYATDVKNEVLRAEYTVAEAVVPTEVTLKSITPAAGSALESIATNWTIELEGGDDVTELECTMTEKADSENVVGNFFITKGDDGFVKDMTDTFAEKMLKDVDYTLSIVCISYPSTGGREEVATLTVDYVGAAVVVDNISTIKISSVNPAANSVIGADNNKVTLEFTGAVEWISGYITEGGQMAQKFDVTAVAANDAKTSYTIDLALENLEKINGGEFSLFMNWKDAEGKYVVFEKNDQYQGDYYNADTECRSTVWVLYQCMEGGKVVTVTPAAGEVTELYTFKLSYDGETPIALNGNVASIVLKDAAGKEVAKGASVKEENTSTEAGDTFSTWIEVTLDKKVTEVGTYTLVIPQDAIVIGDSTHGSYLYKGQTVEYTIKAQSSGVAQLLGEAGVADVYNLQGMLVVRGADAETVKALAPGIYIVNGKKVVVK